MVRYLRPDHYDRRAEHDKPWSVRHDTRPGNYSDWTHEREWRVPTPDPEHPFLMLGPQDVQALLVDRPYWQPSTTVWHALNGSVLPPPAPGMVYDPAQSLVSGPWATVPRLFWDGSGFQWLTSRPPAPAPDPGA
ncbi:hypothetical protein [Catellatospora methionotrophica]|uniref:hypothetical protein n=1 Tax=Catellatospora methionotrophica TaxID=121620 RepID=UPI0033E52A89